MRVHLIISQEMAGAKQAEKMKISLVQYGTIGP